MSQKQEWDECLYNDPKFVEFLEQEEREMENEMEDNSKIEELKDVAAQWAIDFLEGNLSIEDEDYQILHTILVCLLDSSEE